MPKLLIFPDPEDDNQIPTISRTPEPVENVETPQEIQRIENLGNTQSPKISKNDVSPRTIFKNLEKRGVIVESTVNKKKSQKEVNKKRVDKRNTCHERREESEGRIFEDKCEDLTNLVKSVLQNNKEKKRREELEKKEQEKKEQENREKLEKKEEERRKELELEMKEQEKKERKLLEKVERIERGRLQELKIIERERLEELKRIERGRMEELKRIERERMEELQIIERERMEKIERREQEFMEREKKYQERRHHENRKQEDESPATILKSSEIVEVFQKRNKFPNCGDLPLESVYQEKSSSSNEYLTPTEFETEEATSGKRGLLFPDCEENLPGSKRSRRESSTEKQILTQNKIGLQSKPQERGDFQSSEEEFANCQETDSEERHFTQVNSNLSQLATKNSSVELFESDELMNEDEFINQGQLFNEDQLESRELDSQISENNQIPPILTQLPMKDDDRRKTKRFVENCSTQSLLDNLSLVVDSMGNKTPEHSGCKIPRNQEKIQESQDSNQRLKNFYATEKEPSPLLDDISKALLQDEDSETDFEMSIDKDPLMIRNSASDVEIIKYEKRTDKSPYQNIETEIPENIEKSATVNLNDDDSVLDAETILYCNQDRISQDLIPQSKEEKKEKSGLQKKEQSTWSEVFKESQEQIDFSEDLPKKVSNQNKNKENSEEIVPKTKIEKPESTWPGFFSS